MVHDAPLLPVDEALRLVLREAAPLPVVEVPLSRALGMVLAEEVASDVDHPPFAKALMDGWAVRAGDPGPYEVLEEVAAGRLPSRPLRPGACSKVMTGAPLPEGADAVREVEKAKIDGGRVVFESPVVPGQNMAPRGHDARAGQALLRPGHRLRAAEIGILAAAGRAGVRVHRRPRVAVAATGDELVAPGEVPGPGRI